MASPLTITQCLNRLNAHCRGDRSEQDLAVIAADLQPLLRHFDDALVVGATNTFIVASDWFPSTSEFVNEVQNENRIRVREHSRALGTGSDPQRDHIADAKVAVRGIRVGIALGLPPASTWDEIAARAGMDLEGLVEVEASHQALLPHRGGTDPRGHDHHDGKAGCPKCSPHDHSRPDWRESCPVCGSPLPDLYAWSVCSGCDGGGWVTTAAHGHGDVRPCSVCNAHTFGLWSGGHMAAGHRCEQCAPTRRQRRERDDD